METGTCQAIKKSGEGCERRVPIGQRVCWQHAHGLSAKWRSLTRSQVIAFYIGVVGIIVSIWFGVHNAYSTFTTINQTGKGNCTNIVAGHDATINCPSKE